MTTYSHLARSHPLPRTTIKSLSTPSRKQNHAAEIGCYVSACEQIVECEDARLTSPADVSVKVSQLLLSCVW